MCLLQKTTRKIRKDIPMTYEVVRFGWDIAQTLLIAAVGIMNWLNNRQKATAAEMSSHAVRIAKLESRIESLPTQDDLKEISASVSKISGDFREFKGEMHGVSLLLSKIHEFLLSQDKAK